MKEAERFLASFDPLPDGVELPARIMQAYEPESCLTDKDSGFAWRMRRRSDGALFVLKASPAGAEDLHEEFEILTRLSPVLPSAVPAPGDCFEENGMAYLVRSYLPGETLAQYRERSGGCLQETCIQIGRRLCALLQTLHSQQPPVIHRDIKPENIIIRPGGEVGLIDFGIARQYKAGQDTDTRHMGTRATAAPEQYGYAQTDRRTDLYALGMTLIWLATGTYDRDGLDRASGLSPSFRRALAKAVSFAPGDRFQNATAFSAALAGQPCRRSKGACVLAAAGVLCAAVVVTVLLRPELPAKATARNQPGSRPAGFTVAAANDEQLPAPDLRPVELTSGSMEAAIRLALQKPEGEITYDDLTRIERLAVVGQLAFDTDQTFDYRIGCYVGNQYMEQEPWGDITDADLAVLADMPNLKELYLCCQEFSDISVLGELDLTTLALCQNKILDFSPLASQTRLETLYLGGNPGTDYSVLAGLTRLQKLVVGGSGLDGVAAVDSLSFLDGLTLRELGLGLAVPKDGDWEPLTRQIALNTLQLWDPPEAALQAVNTLSGLKSLGIGDFFFEDLTMFSGLSSLEVLGIHKGALESLEGIGAMQRLITLSVGFTTVTDLSPLVGLDRLNYVQFETLPIADFSPLLQLPALGYVCVNADQQAQVEADCPGYAFEIRIN